MPCVRPTNARFESFWQRTTLVNQKVTTHLLRRDGHEVVCASTGKEALRALDERGPFDLVLMDVQMPEMDGFEATRRIRQQRRFNRMPIIALTAHAMKGDREKCLEAGMDDYPREADCGTGNSN